MKQYVIDQLRQTDYVKVLEYLDANCEKTALEGLYRKEMPAELLSAAQAGHAPCQPHYFAINLDVRRVSFELLVRSSQIIRCNCIDYATRAQRDYILAFADGMLEELGIRI
jgi:hypothetical protein